MKIHIEENDKPLTKEQVEALTKEPIYVRSKFGKSFKSPIELDKNTKK